jgi:hypothetical protein
MWQFFSSAFDRNKGAFDRRRALRLCKGSVLARRRAMSSHAARMWQFYVRSTATKVRSTAELHCVFVRGACARTQTRDELARKRERSGIGGSAFDRKYCVRPHCLFFEFSRTRTEC